MSSAARYFISAVPTGFTNNSGAGAKVVQSGKLTSANTTTPSTIITVPAGPKDADLLLSISPVYGDATAKSGHGFAFVQLSEPGADPVMAQTEKAVEDAARVLLAPPAAGYNSPGGSGFTTIVRPGQRFAIIDAGFAL